MAGEPTYDEANRLQRGVRTFASTAPGAWAFARAARHLDAGVLAVFVLESVDTQ